MTDDGGVVCYKPPIIITKSREKLESFQVSGHFSVFHHFNLFWKVGYSICGGNVIHILNLKMTELAFVNGDFQPKLL